MISTKIQPGDPAIEEDASVPRRVLSLGALGVATASVRWVFIAGFAAALLITMGR